MIEKYRKLYMQKIINYYKKSGQTPLDCVLDLRLKDISFQNIPITYAGRLDPLASGVLLLLVGEECKKKDQYLKLSKEYELTILFGFSTDTYDLLGKVVERVLSAKEIFEKSLPVSHGLVIGGEKGEGKGGQIISNISLDCFNKKLKKFTGQIEQKYPPYSSRTVLGKPLFVWAREGKLDEIEIPSHKVLIKNIEIIGEKNICGKDIFKKIKTATEIIKGDFRQKEILKEWQKEIYEREEEIFKTITLRISAGSGFYARSLAYDIGQKLGIPTLAYEIIRTKVGEYTI